MSVLIGVSASVNARFSAFTECLANLEQTTPTSTVIETGIDIGANRNAIVRRALNSGFDHVWFVDDDMTFKRDHLQQLLSHNQPVVASLYLNRKPPHYAVAFNDRAVVDGVRVWRPVTLGGAPETGLADVIAAGTGGMLVRTDVFHAIEYGTWFDHQQAASGEDLEFCQRVIDAGFPIYLDLAAVMGHISTYEIWPQFQKQQGWNGEIRISGNCSFNVRLGD